MTKTEFLKKTNEEYSAWCKTYYQPEALDERGMVSLHGLWAWQEQEKRIAELEGQVRLLRDALGELVALKNMKDRAESAEDSSTNAYCGTEYTARKPAAWKAAREALTTTEPKL